MAKLENQVTDEEIQQLIHVPTIENGLWADDREKWIIEIDGVRVRGWSGNEWSSKARAYNALANSHHMYWSIRAKLAELRNVNEIDYAITRDKKFRKKYVNALIQSGRAEIKRIQ